MGREGEMHGVYVDVLEFVFSLLCRFLVWFSVVSARAGPLQVARSQVGNVQQRAAVQRHAAPLQRFLPVQRSVEVCAETRQDSKLGRRKLIGAAPAAVLGLGSILEARQSRAIGTSKDQTVPVKDCWLCLFVCVCVSVCVCVCACVWYVYTHVCMYVHIFF